MSRNVGGGSVKLTRQGIIRRKCPKCGHHKMWESRISKTGNITGNTKYNIKCSRCTYQK